MQTTNFIRCIIVACYFTYGPCCYLYKPVLCVVRACVYLCVCVCVCVCVCASVRAGMCMCTSMYYICTECATCVGLVIS